MAKTYSAETIKIIKCFILVWGKKTCSAETIKIIKLFIVVWGRKNNYGAQSSRSWTYCFKTCWRLREKVCNFLVPLYQKIAETAMRNPVVAVICLFWVKLGSQLSKWRCQSFADGPMLHLGEGGLGTRRSLLQSVHRTLLLGVKGHQEWPDYPLFLEKPTLL